MQRRAAIWILGAFKTSLTEEIKVLYPSNLICKNLEADRNFICCLSQLIISFKLLWTLHLVLLVVATTWRNGTCSMLTSAKLSVDYLVVGITRELNKEPSLYWSSIYITGSWSVLQQYYSCPNVHALSSCSITHPHVFSIRPPCFLHVHTMCTLWGTHVPWRHS